MGGANGNYASNDFGLIIAYHAHAPPTHENPLCPFPATVAWCPSRTAASQATFALRAGETFKKANRMNFTGSGAGIKSAVITLAFIFLFIVAVLLDLQYLYLMSVTLAVLPLTSYALAYFFATRFTAVRTHPATVREGRRLPVTLTVQGRGGLPQSALRVAETLPDELLPVGEAGSGVASPLDTWDGVTGERVYFLEPQKRGVYALGPTRLEMTDPLGLFNFGVSIPVQSEIVVHPEPVPSRDRAVGGEGTYGIRERDGKTRRGDGMDFHGVREYRTGDALRRIHWPTTARRGKLAVVEFERAYQQDIVVALDRSVGMEYGTGRATTLEYAVKIAATLIDRTLAAGGGVTLITQGGRETVRPREGDPEAARFQLFDRLARLQADAPTPLADDLAAARPGEGTHYALITAGGEARLSAFLTNRIRHGDSVSVYFIEPASFGGPQVTSPAVAGGDLRIVRREHDPWQEGGKGLEYILREGH